MILSLVWFVVCAWDFIARIKCCVIMVNGTGSMEAYKQHFHVMSQPLKRPYKSSHTSWSLVLYIFKVLFAQKYTAWPHIQCALLGVKSTVILWHSIIERVLAKKSIRIAYVWNCNKLTINAENRIMNKIKPKCLLFYSRNINRKNIHSFVYVYE